MTQASHRAQHWPFIGMKWTWLLLFASRLCALDVYVAPTGNDTAEGTSQQPLASLTGARDYLRRSGKLGKEPVTVHLNDGTYFLAETFVLTAIDSGTKECPVAYQAEHEGKVVISGGILLRLKWEDSPNGVFKAKTPAGLKIDQLFADGTRQILARYPNYNPELRSTPYRGAAADAFAPSRAARWKDPTGGYIHAMHQHHWGGYHYRITGKEASNKVSYVGGWQNNRGGPMHAKDRMVENIFEELDAPGEWFHDEKNNLLYFMPPAGLAVDKAEFIGVRLANLIELRGTSTQPAHHISFKGLTFRHAARTFMETREPLLRSDWTFYRGAAVMFTGAEDCSVSDSEFDQLGGNALLVSGYARKITFNGLHVHDAGASGISFVGDVSSVRNPLLHYDQRLKVSQLDRTPGPKSPDYPSDCLVEDCLISRVGQIEKQGAGVEIEMAARMILRQLTIHETSRAGINIGDGGWGGHIIEGCDVFDTVLETGDHGSFNSWGRDRYWGATNPEDIAKEPGLPFLDAMEPTEIRFSRWRCDHGWDVDLDDGSSNYRIHHNIFLNGGLKFREGYGRSAWNNIFVNCGFHPHVWYPNSGDTLERNILLGAHAPIGMPKVWGKTIDNNLFAKAGDLNAAKSLGVESRSTAGDPLFVDADNGDFQVKPGSPALKMGFENFPTDDFGVRKPTLRAIAPTPRIDAVSTSSNTTTESTQTPAIYWRGLTVKNMVGEEYSAFGVSKETRGVVLSDAPAGHPLSYTHGKSTLVLAVNSQPVNDIAAFIQSTLEPVKTLTIIRDQKPVTVDINPLKPCEVNWANDVKALTPKPGVLPTLKAKWTASPAPANGPATELGDGKLVKDYGPVFANSVRGRYLADLGKVVAVNSLRTWSYAQSASRLPQRFTVLGSKADKAPKDISDYTYLGEVDTRSESRGSWHFTSLPLTGNARWILILPEAPVNETENTVYQEVEIGG